MDTNLPNFEFEKELWLLGHKFIIGVDEVGRGCFAGNIVAGAVAFSAEQNLVFDEVGINDSKQMKPREREKAEEWIKENCLAWGIGEINVAIINKIGIAKATKMAFRKAIDECKKKVELNADFLLIDAFYVPHTKGLKRKNQKAIIHGDAKSVSIAAASIIAKVYRDKKMQKLSKKYPQYGWGRNKGYGTKEHQEAIKKHGLTRHHRKKFVETFLKKDLTQ